jgi:arylsulfatase A-like enzyme
MLGDHELWRKSLPYEGSAHIPYFFAWRNMDLVPGTCDALVGLEDIPATVLDLCGIPQPPQYDNDLDSRSLAPALRGEKIQPREVLFGECGGQFDHHYVVRGPLKYVWFPRTNEEQLFDVIADPREERDISESETLLQPLRQALAGYLAEREDRQYDLEKLTPCCNRPPQALWGSRAQPQPGTATASLTAGD